MTFDLCEKKYYSFIMWGWIAVQDRRFWHFNESISRDYKEGSD